MPLVFERHNKLNNIKKEPTKMDFVKDKIRNDVTKLDDFPKDFLEQNILSILAQVTEMLDTTEEILSTLSLSEGLDGVPNPLTMFPMNNNNVHLIKEHIAERVIKLDETLNALFPTDERIKNIDSEKLLKKYKPKQEFGIGKLLERVRNIQIEHSKKTNQTN